MSKEETENLVSTIKDWSIAHGLAVRPPPSLIPAETDPHNVLATTAPVTLFPSPFPKVCFEQATAIQKSYNELYAAIAQDEDFLKDIVEEYDNVFRCVRRHIPLRSSAAGKPSAARLSQQLPPVATKKQQILDRC